MAHPAQLDFFARVIELFPEQLSGRVVDIGSTDINGGPQDLLSPRLYVGVDLAPGPNVGVVGDGARLPLRDTAFDAAISSECFEHTPVWPEIVAEMIRVTRPSGLIAFSAASIGRAEHGTSRSDGGTSSPASVGRGHHWYRNLSERRVVGVLRALHLPVSMVCVDRRVCDLYAIAIKEPTTPDDRRGIRLLGDALTGRPGPNRYRRRVSGVALGLVGDRAFRWIQRHRPSA